MVLRIRESESAQGAKNYFINDIAQADYLTKGEQLLFSEWGGKGAELLGLNGRIEGDDFIALLDNKNPATGQRLTLRNKKDRIPGYEFTFSTAKGISALYALGAPKERAAIRQMFIESVKEAMAVIESEMKTRVRKGGLDETRITGNMLFGMFLHDKTRPIEDDNLPDMHLHMHVYAISATLDPVEKKWKAGYFRELMENKKYFQAVFDSIMAKKLRADYGIERMDTGPDILGVPQSVRDTFSRRTAEIEATAKTLDLDAKAEDLGIHPSRLKDRLGGTTRKRKDTALALSADELREAWRAKLTEDEKSALANVKAHADKMRAISAREAVQYALAHHLEREAVVPKRSIITTALNYGVGSVTLDQVQKQVDRLVRQGRVILKEREGVRQITTIEALREEQKIIALARAGRNTKRALRASVGKEETFAALVKKLDKDQRAAIDHILNSTDEVIGVRGRAGTGKTTLLRAFTEILEQSDNHHRVFAFAPSSTASRGVQRKEGWKDAETVATLLASQELQRKIAGQVVLVDEAGTIANKDLLALMRLARKQQARLILVGDTTQHAPVGRGDALRLLEQNGAISQAAISTIYRQTDEDYRRSVELISQGKTKEGLAVLDGLGWIKEIKGEARYEQIGKDFLEVISRGDSAIVLSPVHKEGQEAAAAIRAELKQAGRIGQDDHKFLRVCNLHWTDAEKQNAHKYKPGQVIQFHYSAPGFSRGSRVEVVKMQAGKSGDKVMVKNAKGKETVLPLTARFSVYAVESLKLAEKESVRITHNGQGLPDASGQKPRVNNGELVIIKNFTDNGDMVLTNGITLPKDFAHLAPAYYTSHASQGATFDVVLNCQGAASMPASDSRQNYVTVSRGRKQAILYTHDKKALFSAAQKERVRLTARDLVMGDEKTPINEKQRKITLHHLRGEMREQALQPDKVAATPKRATKARAARQGVKEAAPEILQAVTTKLPARVKKSAIGPQTEKILKERLAKRYLAKPEPIRNTRTRSNQDGKERDG